MVKWVSVSSAANWLLTAWWVITVQVHVVAVGFLCLFVWKWLCSSVLPAPSHICILYWLHSLCLKLIGKWNCFSDCFNPHRSTQLVQRFLTLGRDPCLNDMANLNEYFKPMSAINVIYICNVLAWLPNYVGVNVVMSLTGVFEGKSVEAHADVLQSRRNSGSTWNLELLSSCKLKLIYSHQVHSLSSPGLSRTGRYGFSFQLAHTVSYFCHVVATILSRYLKPEYWVFFNS